MDGILLLIGDDVLAVEKATESIGSNRSAAHELGAGELRSTRGLV